MAAPEPQTEYLVMLRSHKIHRALRQDGQRLVDERCNTDNSAAKRTVGSLLELRPYLEDGWVWCKRCAPKDGG